ncbi:hypothetical protein ACIHAA_21285 [Streptomyces sp. NPDC052040]|uniref:hypothetical protein n=1 Tax=Streptomyces sp. NPDC052040 TaxID=3365682 RepID=UPI0037D25D5D
MIRIVTAGRLRRMSEATEQARTRAREVQEQADAALSRHLKQVWELTGRAERAEHAAPTAAWDKEVAEAALKVLREETNRLEDSLEAAAEQAAERGEEIRRLCGELETAEQNVPLVLLLHGGEPHSIHRSRQDAYAYAATRGAPVHGWVPSDEHPAAEVAWRSVPFTPDEAVRDFRAVSVSSSEGSEGQA